jgi:hypothetical protein|nr:MAG TPA: DNA encapsidation protein [Caudoviricetes sp.]
MSEIAWLNINDVLSHNVPIMMILGVRGCGKTFGVKKHLIKRYVKAGRRFVYVFRTENQMKRILSTTNIFEDINDALLFDEDISCQAKGAYYGDEQLCYFIPLSLAKDFKRASFPDVDAIMFDEFLIEEGQTERYLKQEPVLLSGLIDTVFRNREKMEVYLLGNATTIYNPYALYYGVDKPYGKNVSKSKDGRAMIYLAADEEFIKYREQTAVGKLINNTVYGSFSLHNKFQAEKAGFIDKKKKCKPLFTFTYEEHTMGAWISYELGKMWISEDVDPQCRIKYSLTVDGHNENTMLVKAKHGSMLDIAVQYYRNSCLFFENQKVKEIFMNVLKMYL